MDYAEEYGALHKSDKRFPGYSLRSYIDPIGKLIGEHRPLSMLDYGCGKGYQYLAKRMHDKWPGAILPHCYDIGVPQLSARPSGRFGGVICTDVLEHIERQDLPGIIDELLGLTDPNGFLFLGISCRPTRKTLRDGRDVHRTIEPPSWWRKLLEEHHVRSDRPHVVVHWDVAGHFDEPETPFELVRG